MQRYYKILGLALLLLIVGYGLWEAVSPHTAELKAQLIQFKKYCRANLWTGYVVYTTLLSVIILAGLPLATLAMLLAGVIYSFWEATTLITLCRLAAAAISFMLVRQMFDPQPRASRHAPALLRKFERHPNVGLFLARLFPIPDSVVNYTLAASPIRHRDYVVVSLLGMIPFTLLCVWAGQKLGTVSGLVRLLN